MTPEEWEAFEKRRAIEIKRKGRRVRKKLKRWWNRLRAPLWNNWHNRGWMGRVKDRYKIFYWETTDEVAAMVVASKIIKPVTRMKIWRKLEGKLRDKYGVPPWVEVKHFTEIRLEGEVPDPREPNFKLKHDEHKIWVTAYD